MAKTNSHEHEQLASILSFFLIGVIWYFADEELKKNKVVKHFTKQALVLFGVAILVGIITSILAFVPIIGWIAMLVLNITLIVLLIIGIIRAVKGDKEKLPLIGEFDKYLTY